MDASSRRVYDIKDEDEEMLYALNGIIKGEEGGMAIDDGRRSNGIGGGGFGMGGNNDNDYEPRRRNPRSLNSRLRSHDDDDRYHRHHDDDT